MLWPAKLLFVPELLPMVYYCWLLLLKWTLPVQLQTLRAISCLSASCANRIVNNCLYPVRSIFLIHVTVLQKWESYICCCHVARHPLVCSELDVFRLCMLQMELDLWASLDSFLFLSRNSSLDFIVCNLWEVHSFVPACSPAGFRPGSTPAAVATLGPNRSCLLQWRSPRRRRPSLYIFVKRHTLLSSPHGDLDASNAFFFCFFIFYTLAERLHISFFPCHFEHVMPQITLNKVLYRI
jgi:hypothetical protein